MGQKATSGVDEFKAKQSEARRKRGAQTQPIPQAQPPQSQLELDNPELESSVNTEEENALGNGDDYNVRANRSGYEFGY